MLLLLSLFLTFTACKKEKYKNANLVQLEDFGSNDGNLKGFYYEPQNASANMPLLIVLHGCSQTALEVAQLTEWNNLADEYGFYVLYPEQKIINNSTRCFNWFNNDDFRKNSGENESIKNMLLKMQSKFNLNTQQTFITGLSAGGAMSMIMISTYPDLFQGAAIMSGGPYKAASNVFESLPAMNGSVDKTPTEWGNLVRSENPNYQGPYAKLTVFHGINDNVVDFKNSIEIVEQWTDVMGIDLQNRVESQPTSDITQFDYLSSTNVITIRSYVIADLGHALAVNPGNGIEEGGGTGTFAKDKDFFSSYWAGKFFGIVY